MCTVLHAGICTYCVLHLSCVQIDEDSSREGGSEPNSDRGEAAVVREEIITLKLKKMKWHEKMARKFFFINIS